MKQSETKKLLPLKNIFPPAITRKKRQTQILFLKTHSFSSLYYRQNSSSVFPPPVLIFPRTFLSYYKDKQQLIKFRYTF